MRVERSSRGANGRGMIPGVAVGALVALATTFVPSTAAAHAPARVEARPSAFAASHDDGPPDIVLIVTDDQRSDTLWAMPVVSARLAAEGITFPDAFVVNPLCCPSRASILTGDYSHTTLVYGDAPPFGRFEWFDDSSTLATWLDDAGYKTGLFGKYLNGYQHAALTGYVPPGWDRWVAFVAPSAFDYALTIDGEVRRFGLSHSTEILAREAVRFAEDTEGPLFLVYAPYSPHPPAIPTGPYRDAFDDLEPARPPSFDEPDVSDKPAWIRDLPPLTPSEEAGIDRLRVDQYRSLLGVDDAIGLILDALDARGRLRNTLIVFTSDNGLLLGEHRWTKKEAPYEEAIRVPLVLRWDAAGWDAGARRDGVFALNVDLAPTIADAAGIAHPPTEGRSLLPVIVDPASTWREDFLVEHLEGTNPIPTYCAVRSEHWIYVRYATGEEELYDLATDPYELRNAASDPRLAPVLGAGRERLRELCLPPPPGYRDHASTTVPLALIALTVLIGIEAIAGRRRTGRATVARYHDRP